MILISDSVSRKKDVLEIGNVSLFSLTAVLEMQSVLTSQT